MKKKPSVLLIIGVTMFVIGSIIIVFTAIAIRALGDHDAWILTDRFGSVAQENERVYDHLYDFTEHLINDRNHYAILFYTTLGLSSIILAFTFLIWASDRKRWRLGNR